METTNNEFYAIFSQLVEKEKNLFYFRELEGDLDASLLHEWIWYFEFKNFIYDYKRKRSANHLPISG